MSRTDSQKTERKERVQESVRIYSPSSFEALLAKWDEREESDEQKPPKGIHSGVSSTPRAGKAKPKQ